MSNMNRRTSVDSEARLRWQLGPYEIAEDRWLAGWSDYADRNFHRSAPGNALRILRVALRYVSESAYEQPKALGGTLEIREDAEGRFHMETPDLLSATFDIQQGKLEVDVLGFAEAPEINFGNALRGAVSVALPLQFDGLMFHASSGILDGKGVFFPGISTAGKTTLALGFEKVTYLSDDITLTQNLIHAPTLCASPFFGIAGRKGANEDAPLFAVGVLVKKNPERTIVRRLSMKESLRELMRHAVCWSPEPKLQQAIFAQVQALLEKTPVFGVERFIGDSSDEIMEQVLEAAARSA